MGEISKINMGGVDYDIRDKVLEEQLGNINAKPMVSVTYAELVELRDNGKLIAGMQYHITDYVTTTTQENTRSAGHQFDVIVLALSENTLAEEAYAIQSARDTDGYFANSNLAAWKLWYSLDNDAQRFTWADTQNGKGIIYRMIDEFNNDIPYDFKNIQFARYGLNIPEYNEAFTPVEEAIYDMVKTEMEAGNEAFVYAGLDEDGKIWESDEERVVSTTSGRVIWCYTFNDIRVNLTDGYDQSRASINGITNNYMELYNTRDNAKYSLPNNVFLMEMSCDNHFSLNVTNNTFMFVQRADITRFYYNVTSIRFTDAKLRMVNYSAFASNVIDLKAERCSQLFLGDECERNEFGPNCNHIILGRNSSDNTFETDCTNIVMGVGSCNNSFEKGCADNLFSNVNGCVFGGECCENDFSSVGLMAGCVFGSDACQNTCSPSTAMIIGLIALEGFNNNSFDGDIEACNFGKDCRGNTFGSLYRCTVGSKAWGNKISYLARSTFLEECHHNTIGQDCSEITFGNYSYGNTIGDSCRNITFENGANMNAIRVGNTDSADVRHLCRNIRFEEGVSGVVLYNSQDALSEDLGALKNIVVKKGFESTSPVFIEVEADRDYETSVAKNSQGEIKIYCEADLLN